MKKIFVICIFLFPFICKGQEDYTKFVNPFIGTGGHGHTYPGATMPFGMVQLSPDTRIDQSWDGCSGYHYSDSMIYGFSHTHLSGTGVPDYCDILLMPVSGDVTAEQIKMQKFSSPFSHSKEIASPGFYSVHLDQGNIDVALTTTTRTGFHKYTFNQKEKDNSIILDLVHRDKLLNGTIFKISDTRVGGFRQSESWARNQVVMFVIDFSQPFESCITSTGEAFAKNQPVSGTDTKAAFRFKNNGTLYVKVALSVINNDGAIKNMEAENPGWDFELIKKNAHDAWLNELGKIEVKGGSQDQRTIFYTALYHCFVVPNMAMDVDSMYHGRDQRVHKASGFTNYSVFSLWDTFRAWHPLMTIIDQKRTVDFIRTFLVQSDQGRLLPVWELAANETECMIGYHAVSVIADAALKGIGGFNKKEALMAMKKSAEAEWRYGLDAYMKQGFIGVEDEPESVSKTLEYAYDDWCIAQMASLTGSITDEKNYRVRSQYWKNVFDTQSGFVRPRRNGNWLKPFDPKEVNNHFTEANAWQYTFFVPQDVNGLINKMGGAALFEKKLDEFFTTDSKTTGREQADITGLIGQYAHGNEPSHHIAYLYNYIGQSQKAQNLVYRIMNEMYQNTPDGLIGNEDCGQMSAWFVLSAMGFYQVTPGKPEFQLGVPLFPSVKIHLENRKTFSVTNVGFIESDQDLTAFISGSSSPVSSLKYDDIVKGKTLSFKKTSLQPVKKLMPYVPVSDSFITAPRIVAEEVFKEKTLVTLESDSKSLQLFYSVDQKDSLIKQFYTKPFEVDSSVTIRTYAKDDHGRKSTVSFSVLHKMPHPDWKLNAVNTYSAQYSAGGPEGLIDGIRGDENWRKGYWQGYWGKDAEFVIDLGRTTSFDSVYCGFLQDTRSWILMPKRALFSFSNDGINFTDSLVIENTVRDQDYEMQTRDFISGSGNKINCRYIKLKAINYGKLPLWHLGAGGDAYIFIDEIGIK